MLVYTVILSCLKTGQVRRHHFVDPTQASKLADRHWPTCRHDCGYRVERVTKNTDDMTLPELQAMQEDMRREDQRRPGRRRRLAHAG